jgi:putative membrane protein
MATSLTFIPVPAHQGAPPTPEDLWATWAPDPIVVVAIALALAVYVRGVRAVWRRSGRGNVVTAGQVAAFAAGTAALAVALVSPLDHLASALFAAHMAQHLLLTVVAAPLLVIGARRLPFARALPPAARRVVGRWERRLVGPPSRQPRLVLLISAVVVFTITFWLWHTSVLYQAALDDRWVHALEHASMLGAALLFWWATLQAARRGQVFAAVLALFAVSAQEVALAGLITLAPTPWYPVYATPATAWGLGALADQQIAGSLMWTLGAAVYLAAAAALLIKRLDRPAGRRADEPVRPVGGAVGTLGVGAGGTPTRE